jgi:hypothetical protein
MIDCEQPVLESSQALGRGENESAITLLGRLHSMNDFILSPTAAAFCAFILCSSSRR